MPISAKPARLTDFTPDPRNANKGTERGSYVLNKSVSDLGLGRSIVVDKHGVVIAGNKTLETAVSSGFENAVVVDTQGDQLVVVRRTDLDLETDDRAKKLAVADNRAGEVSLDWDAEVLKELHEDIDLSDYFTPIEIEGWDADIDGDDDDDDDSPPLESYVVPIVLTWAEKKEWDALKESSGESNDKRLFLQLIRGSNG